MTATTTHLFIPSFRNPDDMPEYISIYDKPKKIGRPKLYFTVEEIAESKRIASNTYHTKHYSEYQDIQNMKRNLKRSAEKEIKQ